MLTVELRVRTCFHEGLFNAFPGPFLEISKTFLWQFNSNPSKMFVLNDTGLVLWHSTRPQNTYRNLQKGASKHVQTRHVLHTCSSTYMPKSNERKHWKWKTLPHFHTFCEHWECYALLTWAFVCMLSFTQSLKSIHNFQSHSNKNQGPTFKNQKPISSTLKSDSCNSRVFKMCAKTENLRVWWRMCL